jgi:hypothetical protein
VIKGGGKERVTWGKTQQWEFDDIKHRLFLSLVLSLPYLQWPFEIENDASDYVVGTILSHKKNPVAYHSETLSDTVAKYPTYDKEMYSIVESRRQWKNYILGKDTIIHTDHKPL